MNALEIIDELTRRGVEVRVEEESLRVRAARGTLTPELQRLIAHNKAEMMELLRKRSAPPPPLVPDPAAQHEPFPLTDIQQAYLVGRTSAFGVDEIACHLYHEFDATDLDVSRLSLAWERLIAQHPMLRSVVLPDGTQRVLECTPPFSIPVVDLRGERPDVVERELSRIRGELSTRAANPGEWPSFALRATLLDDRTRIHFDFDLITADASGMLMLLEEWRDLYVDPERPLRPLPISFRDYVHAELAAHGAPAYARAEAYWDARVAELPPAPALPLAVPPERLVRPPFRRVKSCIEAARWSSLKQRAADAGLTPSGLLCAAYAEVLAAFSESARFTLNLTLFRRLPLHAEVDRLVGDFTTTVLLEVDGQGASFVERARRLRDQLARDLEHTEVSGVKVLREIAKRQDGAAMMPVVFTSLLGHRTRTATGEPVMAWLGEIVHAISQTPQVWLDHQVREDAGALVFSWDSPEGLLPDGLLDDAFAAYDDLLRRLADDPALWSAAAAVRLPPAQRARREADVAATPIPEVRLEELFLAQAALAPARPAVIAEDRTLEYGELRERAEALAHELRAAGARPETLVAIAMRKGWRQVVAVLAVHLAGAAYLPIDPALPEARRALLLDEGGVEIALTEPALARELSFPPGVRAIAVDDAPATRSAAAAPRSPRSPGELAYCIYTSGSTGRPKGVMIEHRAAVNTIADINRRFEIGADDRVLALSSLGFDLSVYDIFGSLAAGAAVVVPEPSAARDPARWLELLRARGVTVWNSVPMLMEMLVDLVEARNERLPSSLRLVLLSGDWIPVSLPGRIRRLSGNVKVISLGGATEAAIWSILHPIERLDPEARSVPYGRAMRNQRFHVLDDALSPRPDYVPGELFIGGAGLARGYFRDEATTKARFIEHPRTGERLYRTGDMGRFLPDGTIEFLGRKDFQVKIAGHRIELGEIEAALLRHPGIREAVVAAPGERTRRRLVAYVVAADEHAPPPADDALREFLKGLLPDYMVPGVYVRLRELPLSANGKIDRKALPEPVVQTARGPGALDALDARGDAIVAKVARVACSVLKLSEIDPDQRLLQLGATSVELIQLATLLDRELGSRPRMAEFIKLRTVAEIAAYYIARQPAASAPAPDGAASRPDGADETSAEDVAERSLLLDAAARDAFKRDRRGIRRFDGAEPALALASSPDADDVRRRHLERASHRAFSAEPVDAAPLGRLLECLRPLELDGERKYQYGSAGSSYSVQAYLEVRPGRVQGLSEGGYYYDPAQHRLVQLSSGRPADADIHTPANRQMAERSAFAIFLVCDRAAIAPLYGEKWRDFALIEAGLIAQLLETRAAEVHLGLCQVGEVRFEDLRALFRLEASHVHLHSVVGGGVAWEEGAV